MLSYIVLGITFVTLMITSDIARSLERDEDAKYFESERLKRGIKHVKRKFRVRSFRSSRSILGLGDLQSDHRRRNE